jgi:endonuclease/exonuclease/phosphatase family metal-dependent hydrolase
MNYKAILYCLILVSVVTSVQAQKSVNVMTYNIRLDLASDSLNAWPYRKVKLASQILFHQAHILGVQEALPHQLQDMLQSLRKYKYVGRGRDDNKEWSEHSAIFYDTTRMSMLSNETFWLSENPNAVGIKGWDAALPRIVTYACFKDKRSKKKFYVFNTHFDHKGSQARSESAKLLLTKVAAIAGDAPCIIMGDFNAKPADDPIKILTNESDAAHLTDSKMLTTHYGPTGTFNGFGPKEQSDDPIDYIFIKNKVKVVQHATLSQTWRGRFASDHFAVCARVYIGKK